MIKRLLIPFVASLGLSLGATTGIVWMRAPAPKAHAARPGDSANVAQGHGSDSTEVADSTHGDSVHGDSVHGDSVHTDSAVAHTDTTHPAKGKIVDTPAVADAKDQPAGGAPGETATHPSRVMEAKVIPASLKSARQDTLEKRLAKVFASMQSRDAAHILQQMDDGDVQTILGSLSPKQQAAILGQFPPQRAALLARATLRGGGSSQ